MKLFLTFFCALFGFAAAALAAPLPLAFDGIDGAHGYRLYEKAGEKLTLLGETKAELAPDNVKVLTPAATSIAAELEPGAHTLFIVAFNEWGEFGWSDPLVTNGTEGRVLRFRFEISGTITVTETPAAPNR